MRYRDSIPWWERLIWFFMRPRVFIPLIILMVVGGVIGAIVDQQNWNTFAQEHNCQVVAKSDGTMSYGFGTTIDGKMGYGNIYTPGHTTYKCDNGVLYTR